MVRTTDNTYPNITARETKKGLLVKLTANMQGCPTRTSVLFIGATLADYADSCGDLNYLYYNFKRRIIRKGYLAH